MSLTIQFHEAGSAYQLNGLMTAGAGVTYLHSLFGAEVSETTSWGNKEPAIGVPHSASLNFASGFMATVNFKLDSTSLTRVTDFSYARTATNETIFSVSGDITVSDDALDDAFNISNYMAGNDQLIGNAAANGFRGYRGNDTIDGGEGTDTAYFSGTKSSYKIEKSGDTLYVSGADGVDTLRNVERLTFDDSTIAFDTSGNAGQIYRLYQAAFNRAPDLAGLGVQIKAMDAGTSLLQLSQNFMNSAEFKSLYGENTSTSTLVNLLYNNVLHRTPQQFEVDFWVNIIDKGSPVRQMPAEVLMNFSESAENQTQIIGVIQNGFDYI